MKGLKWKADTCYNITTHTAIFNMVTETGCDINVIWSLFQCPQLCKNLSGSTNIGIDEISV